MCEIAKGQRRTFRDQDPPRIFNRTGNNSLKEELGFSKSTPSSPTILQRASSFDKCSSEPEILEKDRQTGKKVKGDLIGRESASYDPVPDDTADGSGKRHDLRTAENFLKELADKVPSSGRRDHEVISTNS
ncbi:uncharacterized protein LOC144477250 isoform X2 [Augochlora pura]